MGEGSGQLHGDAQSLIQLAQRLARCSSLELLAKDVANEACFLPQFTAVVVAGEEPPRMLAAAGDKAASLVQAQHHFGGGLSFSEWAMQTGDLVHTPNLACDPRSEVAMLSGIVAGSVLALPMKVGGRAPLALTIHSPAIGNDLLPHLGRFQALVETAALAVEMFDLRQVNQNQARHLLALHEVSRLLTMALDPTTVLSLSVDVATGLFDLDLCCVLLREGDTLRVGAARGLRPEQAGTLSVPTLTTPDLAPWCEEGLIQEHLPIHGRPEGLGFLVVGRKAKGFREDDRRLLNIWTHMIGVMLENAQLLRRAEHARHEVPLALMSHVEARRAETQGFSRAVADLAAALARRLDLPEHAVHDIVTAALLHRVGQFVAPSTQPLLGEVAEQGAEVLGASQYLQAIAPLVRHFQERWDGSGGPEGLVAEQIPLGARVIAVAESYVRLQRGLGEGPPANPAAALITLKAEAGKAYDPVIVAALESVAWSRISLTPAREAPARSTAGLFDRKEADPNPLTERESEILALIAQGHSNREIASALFLSEATVKTHVSRILQKLNLADRTKAAVFHMRNQRPAQ